MKYLVTGKNGQLAQAFIRRLEKLGLDFSAPEESRFDITNGKLVAEGIASYKPHVIINCAAYNLVDKAEQDKDMAFAVNAAGPENLARAAKQSGAFLVHFGSDYVFDGLKENGLYTEDDRANPLNQYGKSKLAGEERVVRECERHLVLRLSWVFGSGKQNFITKLRTWAEKSEYLKIACDEFSVPTYVQTVVDVTLDALRRGLTGQYHLTNSGFCSRYEWAKMVIGTLGIRLFIRPVSMDSFSLPAQRPKFSAMTNKKISEVLNVQITDWEETVRLFLRESAAS